MANKFDFKLITPEGVMIEQTISYLEICTKDGYSGILANHQPFLAQLADGHVRYRVEPEDDLQIITVQDAYFSFMGNKAEIVSATC